MTGLFACPSRRRLLALLLALPALGCVDRSKGERPIDREALAAHVLDAPPQDVGTRLGADFDGKIELLGARVEPAVARPGATLKLTLYWRVKQALGEDGWGLFTHVLDGSGERIMNVDNVGPLRQLDGESQVLPPSKWQAGKVYVDTQEFVVPLGLRTSKLQLAVGIWKGSARLPIKSGPKDAHNRALVATLSTQAPPGGARSEVPSMEARALEPGQTITIDGVLNEPAWVTAASSGTFVDVRSGGPNTRFPVNGSVKLLWDNEHLYVGFEVSDPNVTGGFDPKQTDPHLWTKDTVEIMIDPDGDGDNKDYYEIQINPQNLVFDSQFDAYNLPKVEPNGPFGHQDWSARLKSAVTIQGTLDKPDDKDEGYRVEAAIPWASFTKAKQAPPRDGDTWRMNFYAMQDNGGVAWSPILGQGNFHKASRFGRVTWRGGAPPQDTEAAPAPSASAAPSAAPSAP
ncbi:MAG: carbohydrate-binding family 9-like protein [Polyangiaceae bacterium]|nr:carbohydrate-binding family 9-like protein [Polyangiaceae bacterium]MCW5792324.1 carbohydrate-binding family 9-like protein [Polyangiaceae bacterium]